MSFRLWLEGQYSLEAKELAQKIITNTVRLKHGCIDEPTVMYDAIWHPIPNPPFFINIKTATPGKGLGWVAFLDFLSKVNPQQTFVSTDFTAMGKQMFQKAVQNGLIKQLESPANLGNYTNWLVLKDTYQIIKQIANS